MTTETTNKPSSEYEAHKFCALRKIGVTSKGTRLYRCAVHDMNVYEDSVMETRVFIYADGSEERVNVK